MTKTLEIIHEDTKTYEVVSPDHNERWTIDGYEIEGDVDVLMEDGRLSVDVPPSKYFHVKEKDYEEDHVTISVEDYPQPNPVTFTVSASVGYNFSELVSECGIPDTDQAYEELRHLPRPQITFSYEGGESEVKRVEIDGVVYTPE